MFRLHRTIPLREMLARASVTVAERGEAIDQLRQLFAEQLNQLKRIMARRNFNKTGKTDRGDALVLEAHRVKDQGDAGLNEVPRIATECE